MKWISKVILIVIIANFLYLNVGCSKGTKIKEEILKEKRTSLGFSQMGAECEWRAACTKSIVEAAKNEGIDLIIKDAKQDQESQLKSIRNFIIQKVDVIAFTPVFEDGWEPVLQEAKRAGIPVILVNGNINADPKLYKALIGSDYIKEGRLSAMWLLNNYEKLGLKGDVEIAEIQGTTGSSAAENISSGFYEVISKNKNFKIVESQSGDFTRAKGKEVMENLLRKNDSKIQVLFAHNDDMAIGAIEVMEKYGVRPGKDIIIISIDAVKSAIVAIINGKMNCTVECNPLIGLPLAKLVKDICQGKKVEKVIYLKNQVFSAENAKKTLPSRKY